MHLSIGDAEIFSCKYPYKTSISDYDRKRKEKKPSKLVSKNGILSVSIHIKCQYLIMTERGKKKKPAN